jgi:quinol monooxygenase YgiN
LPFRHIVLFRFRPEVPDAEVARAAELLDSLRAAPGVLEWRVIRSLDERKGIVVAEVGLFETPEHFSAFRASERHAEVSAYLADRADWLVADYVD